MRPAHTTPLLVALALLVPAAPAAEASSGGPFQKLGASRFSLRDTKRGGHYDAIIRALAKRMPKATVTDVLAHANRKAQPLGHPKELSAVKSIAGGFRWQSGDNSTPLWYPQGLTGSADAVADGKWGANHILLTSWYSKRPKKSNEGVRISFVNANRLASATYRHVLLVEPTGTPSHPNFKAVKIHAGGIAWYGRYLYVADTSHGFRLFDVTRMMASTSGSDTIGWNGKGYAAAKYRYVLPQVGSYQQNGKTKMTFSAVSVDRSTTPDSLVVPQYRKGAGGKVVRWNLNFKNGLLGRGRATNAWFAPYGNIQGALGLGGHILLSRSAGASPGALTSGVPGLGSPASHPWAISAEDLTYSAGSDRVYSLTEHPKMRSVFGVPSSTVR